MRCRGTVASPPGRALLVGMCAAGMLVSGGCSPEEVQAPEATPGITIALAVAPTNGLIGEWKLDETSGTTAFDTKNGYNATVAGGAAFVAGRIGNALNLNNGTVGTGGKYAQMPSNAELDSVQEGNYTLSAWFYPYTVPPDTTTDNHHWAVVSKAGWHMGLMYHSDQTFLVRHYLTGNVLKTAGSASTYSLNAWHHVAGVVSKTAGTITLYVNGVAAGSGTFTANTAAREYGTTPFRIGKGSSNWAADGKVDQVRIYNRALSAAEVSDLYNETVGTAPTVTTNAASGITSNAATLNGSADPNGEATTGWFRYHTSNGSCTDSFGTRVPSTGGTSLGSGTTAVAYSRNLTGLLGGKIYYFCAIASNASGTSYGTVRSFMTGGMGLRAGLSGMQTRVGQGPGGNTAEPIYRYVQISASPSTVNNDIQTADANDIVLMVAPSGNRNGWTDTNGHFVWSDYVTQVQRYQGNTVFADAVARRRVLLYVADEPNISSFEGTFTPALLNDAALLHKDIWPTGLTFVRIAPSVLYKGWKDANNVNQGPPPGGYTGIDYAYSQYSGASYRAGLTFAQKLQGEKDTAAMLNIGVTSSLNMWAGGIRLNTDGVTACWDHDQNPSTPTGLVIGTGTLPAGVSEGDFYACGTLPSSLNSENLVANPNWIKRYADVMSQDDDIPFASHWTYPVPGTGVEDWAPAYINRSDFVSALDYAINTGNTRPSWTGYRTPKPPQP